MVQVYRRNGLFIVEDTVRDVIYPNLSKEETKEILLKLGREEDRTEYAIEEFDNSFRFKFAEDKGKRVGEMYTKTNNSFTPPEYEDRDIFYEFTDKDGNIVNIISVYGNIYIQLNEETIKKEKLTKENYDKVCKYCKELFFEGDKIMNKEEFNKEYKNIKREIELNLDSYDEFIEKSTKNRHYTQIIMNYMLGECIEVYLSYKTNKIIVCDQALGIVSLEKDNNENDYIEICNYCKKYFLGSLNCNMNSKETTETARCMKESLDTENVIKPQKQSVTIEDKSISMIDTIHDLEDENIQLKEQLTKRDEEIKTLKKALELACERITELLPFHFITKEKRMNNFIQQAKENKDVEN